MLGTIDVFFTWLFKCLPDVTIPVIKIPESFIEIINAVWYFLPMETIFNLFELGLYITLLRLVLALIIRLKSFIPTMGA